MVTKTLSPLEQKIMDIVWSLGSCSVRDVLIRISTKKKLAYTTVATLFQRLHEKGLVVRKKKGSVIHYSAKVTKEEYGRTVAGSFLDRFFHSFGNAAIASFAESIEKLPKEKKDYFIKLLRIAE